MINYFWSCPEFGWFRLINNVPKAYNVGVQLVDFEIFYSLVCIYLCLVLINGPNYSVLGGRKPEID